MFGHKVDGLKTMKLATNRHFFEMIQGCSVGQKAPTRWASKSTGSANVIGKSDFKKA
jgi:hypothetical protein